MGSERVSVRETHKKQTENGICEDVVIPMKLLFSRPVYSV